MNFQSREIKGITIIGDDFLARDEAGKPLNTLATVFPGFQLAVTGRNEIHGMQVDRAIDYLKNSISGADAALLTENICRDAVCINILQDTIIVRIEQDNIPKGLAADLLLQRFVPKADIKFTGLHIAQARKALRLRGEIWRFAPPPVMEKDFTDLLCHCRTRIGTGMRFFHNKHTGEHVLTYQEAAAVRHLFTSKRREALACVREILHLSRMINHQGYPELSFLIPAGKSLDTRNLKSAVACLKQARTLTEDARLSDGHIQQPRMLYDRFLDEFADQAGPELMRDDPSSSLWRATVLCRLYNIDERTTAEWALGLGPEFYLSIRWLPGAQLIGREVCFEPETTGRIKKLIEYYLRTRDDLVSINVGNIVAPLTDRDQTGEEREVFIVSLSCLNDRREIRHIRMSKWDVIHRIKLGQPLDQAINETRDYRDFTLDRLAAIKKLEIPIPEFEQIDIEDELGHETIPVYFFERDYIPGIATDKIPSLFYAKEGFVSRLAFFLGRAAAVSLALGRTNPRSNMLYYDDGDEIIRLDASGMPEAFILAETTGSFKDWTTPIEDLLPHCVEHLFRHMEKARQQGIDRPELTAAVDRFADGFEQEIRRMQMLINEKSTDLWSYFSHRTSEDGGIRCRWEGVLSRLSRTDIESLIPIVYNSSWLRPYVED